MNCMQFGIFIFQFCEGIWLKRLLFMDLNLSWMCTGAVQLVKVRN